MSRIAELPIEQWDPRLRAMVQEGEQASPLEKKARNMMANAPHIALANAAFLGTAYQGLKLPRRLIELVRLRIAFHNQCRTCMAMRFKGAVEDGLTDDMVCSLEKPMEAANLTDQEKAALEYADLFATNHFAINDETFAKLRRFFSDGEIIELGVLTGYYLGFGRVLASLDIVEELPKALQDKSKSVGPWDSKQSVVVYG
jgi:AhpD family alkylhydroperoxidase